MNYALILAGGGGTRMGKTDMPKQFLKVNNKTFLTHSVEKFMMMKEIEAIVVSCHPDWIEFAKKDLNNFNNAKPIFIYEAGSSRNSSVIKNLDELKSECKIDNEDIIIIHDAVRPFVTKRIIKQNIEMVKKYRAADTVVPASDTIVKSENGEYITEIPDRRKLYQGQTPQSFYINELLEVYQQISEEEKNIMTDTCKIYTSLNKKVGLVIGEPYNIKITNKFDLDLANHIVEFYND